MTFWKRDDTPGLLILGSLFVVAVFLAGADGILVPEVPVRIPVGSGAISEYSLVLMPSYYDDRRVRVYGFCHLEFEGNSLWGLDSEFLEDGYAKADHAVWLQVGWPIPEKWKPFNDHWVFVEAKFDKDYRGHMGGFAGTLLEIENMALAPSPK